MEDEQVMASDIIIAGAGFAGLAAVKSLRDLARNRKDVAVRLFDVRSNTTMVPALPDLAGGRFPDVYLKGEISRLVSDPVIFNRERISAIDLDEKEVRAETGSYRYDYLVIACGSVTDFFGFNQRLDAVHKLDSIEDANRLCRDLDEYIGRCARPTVFVAGGGYTGMELACSVKSRAPGARVSVVELKEKILPSMQDWARDYVTAQAEKKGIDLITGTSVKSFDGTNLELSDGRNFKDVFLCWSTGTKCSVSIISGDVEQARDGRLTVDSCLRVPGYPEVYAVGDSAAFRDRGKVLRKSVNFARDQGKHAGRNICRSMESRKQEDYHPVDLGWVIPFCDVGAGMIPGRRRITGRLPLALHYFFCGLRNYSFRNILFFWKTAGAALFRDRETQ